MDIQNIGIIGLGVIGGSLAKAIKRSSPLTFIKAMDMDAKAISSALEHGVIDESCDKFEDIARGCQFIFLCVPVNSIKDILYGIRDYISPSTIVTDVCSIKVDVMSLAERILPDTVYFIGGHPMAGMEGSGYQYSMAHLFENAFYVLTVPQDAPIDVTKDMINVVSIIGAFPLVMDADTHDEIVGAISHLPHVVAAALVNTVAQLNDPSKFKEKLAAGGFRDITRIASSNTRMWTSISISNREKLLELILSMIDNLEEFYDFLYSGESQKVERLFKRAKDYRDELPSIQNRISIPYHELYVDIEDRPGTIGDVTSLLGRYNINIKNVSIIHSREEDPGCLILSLFDNTHVDEALSILIEKGYRAYRR
ncbi:MAG: prephenate dehydrogenase [Xylanivirga thermophila]|jgi:prephenate dehydrogenase|uniref:prephenate dehydrogenase n=1 Tax=Xylanivirga thermophila TaxID=2496273 RepID=UPI00101D6161|nr:prephenate dehydrogenase [Xylanivirga thermophila]